MEDVHCWFLLILNNVRSDIDYETTSDNSITTSMQRLLMLQ